MKLYLFGSPHLENESQPIHIKRRKGLAILAYLAVQKTPQPRTKIASLLWPTVEGKKARHTLRATLPALTKSLDKGVILADRKTLQLNPDEAIWVDVLAFQQRVKACHQHHKKSGEVPCQPCFEKLLEATSIYQGDFMTGFQLDDCPDYGIWQKLQREHYRQQLLTCYTFLLEHQMASENWEDALNYARQWLTVDEYDERAHRYMMSLLDKSGQRTAVHQHYHHLVDTLQTDLGIAPHADTIALYQTFNGRREVPPASRSQPAEPLPPHNLPVSLTSFLGRHSEIEEVTERLAKPNCRLVTILGPGGIGKSRLSMEVGRACLQHFPQGAFFVPLAPVSSPKLIVATIADAINFKFYGNEDSRQQLLNYLRKKEMLIILDNFEHLREGGELLLDILQTAPKVKMLITSRVALNYQAEWLYEIEGLPYPQQNNNYQEEGFTAVQLFTERAQRVHNKFLLQKNQKSCVAQICQLVEGMPLAIELAAPLLKHRSCQKIAADLSQGIETLKTTMADVPARHRSMQVVIETSWQQLIPDEQLLLQRLSVFRGGFTMGAAEFVAGATPQTLTALADKSLIRMVAFDRFEMHELIRQHSDKCLLEDSNLEHETKLQHCRFFASFISSKQDLLLTQTKTTLLSASIETDNIRQAWQYATLTYRFSLLKMMLTSITNLYWLKGWHIEGEQMLVNTINFLKSGDNPENRTLIPLLVERQGYFCWRQAKFEEAEKCLNYVLDCCLDDLELGEKARLYADLGRLLVDIDRYEDAEDYCKESISIYMLLENPLGEATAQYNLGIALYIQADKEREAEKHLQESLQISRRVGYQVNEGLTLHVLGALADFEGKYRQSEAYLTKCVDIFNAIGEGSLLIRPNLLLAHLKINQKEYQQAKVILDQNLTNAENLGFQESVGQAHRMLGKLAFETERYDEAEAHLKESLKIMNVSRSRNKASILIHLVSVKIAQEQYLEAIDYLIEVMEEAKIIQSMDMTLELIIQASKIISNCDIYRAYRYLDFVLRQPSLDHSEKEKAQILIEQWKSENAHLNLQKIGSFVEPSLDELVIEIIEYLNSDLLVLE